jgi:hypothetical protein
MTTLFGIRNDNTFLVIKNGGESRAPAALALIEQVDGQHDCVACDLEALRA